MFWLLNLNKVIRLWSVIENFLLRWPCKIRFKEKGINVIWIRDISKRYIKSRFVPRGKLSVVCNNKYETSNWKKPF